MIRLAVALTLAGLALVTLSWVWPSVVTPERVWSEEQAKESSKASANLHKRVHEAAEAAERRGATPGQPDAEFDAAIEEQKRAFDEAQAKLDRARQIRFGPIAWFRWIGAVCTLAGLGTYITVRSIK
jgi:hypothetical protein